MRYESKQDLPQTLQDTLPEEAKDIYVEAYQKAWEEYKEWEGGELGQQSVAHQKAMAAVKREYTKMEETGKWYAKGEEPEEEGEEDGILDTLKDKLDVENPLSSE